MFHVREHDTTNTQARKIGLEKLNGAWNIRCMVEQINTADDVLDRLGGTNAVAKLLDCDARVVSNWRARGLPPETFVALTQALNAKDLYAPPSLWRMKAIAAL